MLWFLLLMALFVILMALQMSGQASPAVVVQAALRLAIVPGIGAGVIWIVSGKLKWPEGSPWKFVALQALMALLFAAISTYVSTAPLLRGVRGLEVDIVFRTIIPWQIASSLFIYGLIAGVSYAIRGSWGARDQRLVAERAEKLRAQAELAALRAHINPHFLFNTLHSVTQLLRAEPERAEAALDRLSDLFRYALRLDRDQVETVTLEDEWRFSASYLWLEQMRMGDRLHVASSLSDDALLCNIPPFTLQPLIENAVRHGLSPKVGSGTLCVKATEDAGTLRIEVADDGVGANPEALADSHGIGVRAVRQRLQARYGAKAALHVDGAPEKGIKVVVTMPAEVSQ